MERHLLGTEELYKAQCCCNNMLLNTIASYYFLAVSMRVFALVEDYTVCCICIAGICCAVTLWVVVGDVVFRLVVIVSEGLLVVFDLLR